VVEDVRSTGEKEGGGGDRACMTLFYFRIRYQKYRERYEYYATYTNRGLLSAG
jgi:hypothetical protein